MYILRFCNRYSLDVSAGAMVGAQFFAYMLKVDLSSYSTVLLGLLVWSIYTFDHLDDARSITGDASSDRHYAHQKYFQRITILVIIALLLSAILVFYIPVITVLWGSALMCMVAVYFIILKFLKLNFSLYKEFSIALIYTTGVSLGPLSLIESALSLYHYSIFAYFFLVALTNLFVFSLYDADEDKRHYFPSFVQARGIVITERILYVLLALQFLLSCWLFLHLDFAVTMILMSMSMIIALVIIFRTSLKQGQWYRILGDGIFMLPLILIW